MRKLIIILISIILVSCGEVNRQELLPDSNGAHGEILILMEENLWKGELGKLLAAKLTQNCEGPYLRPEPMFSYIWCDPEDLDHTKQMNRNILKIMLDRDSTYQTTQTIEKRDFYSKNQLFLIIRDSDINRLYRFILNDFNYIAKTFNDFELNSYIRQYKNDPNKNVKETAEKKFGISISIPSDHSELYAKDKDFLWVKRERSQNIMGSEAKGTDNHTYWIQQGILVWSKPYNDPAQLTVDSILKVRDTVLKYNVPGKYPNSYMATEYDPYYKPEGEKINFKGTDAVVIKGLWKHAGARGAFGGGPFVQYTVHHPTRDELITVCCYIYGPKFDKREYIREADAMMHTIEIK